MTIGTISHHIPKIQGLTCPECSHDAFTFKGQVVATDRKQLGEGAVEVKVGGKDLRLVCGDCGHQVA